MPRLLPTDRPDQPVGTAVQLGLKDELRTLEANLHKGAQWLLRDVGGSLVRRMDPTGASAPARRLRQFQQLVDSTAQATFSTLQTARDVAASSLLHDSAYRNLQFQVEPLAHYFAPADDKRASRGFTAAVYWLTRHAIELDEDAVGEHIAREQAIDEVYWRLRNEQEDLLARLQANGKAGPARDQDHAMLCAALLLTLVSAHPIRDARLPPWADRDEPHLDSASARELLILLTVVVTLGLTDKTELPPSGLADRLQLARQMVMARLPFLKASLQHLAPQRALGDELAFLLRHA